MYCEECGTAIKPAAKICPDHDPPPASGLAPEPKRRRVNALAFWIAGLVFIAAPEAAMSEQRQTESAGMPAAQSAPTAASANSNTAGPADKLAQYELARKYLGGSDGFVKDETEAAKWFKRSADQGLAVAQYELGKMYELGRGVPQDDEETVLWFGLAAEQGYAGAQYQLGQMYKEGRGVPQDDEEAEAWFRKAAEGMDEGC
jgi:TPR repeat protein